MTLIDPYKVMVSTWGRAFTSKTGICINSFKGGHFFLHECQEEVVKNIDDILTNKGKFLLTSEDTNTTEKASRALS